MKMLSSAPQLILTAILLSVGGVSCTDPAKTEKITRAEGGRSTGDKPTDQKSTLGDDLQKCDSGVQILDLANAIAAIETGEYSAVSGRLTTYQVRVLTRDSLPLKNQFKRAKSGVEDRVLLDTKLVYRPGQPRQIAEQLPEIFGLVSQDGCKTVSFKTGEEPTNEVAIPQKSFSINLANSTLKKLALEGANGEIRIYEVSSGSKMRVTIYERVESDYCSANLQPYLLETSYGLDMQGAAQEKITMNYEFLNGISKKMSVSDTLRDALTAGASGADKNSAFNPEVKAALISDADYIDILQRITEGEQHFTPTACAAN